MRIGAWVATRYGHHSNKPQTPSAQVYERERVPDSILRHPALYPLLQIPYASLVDVMLACDVFAAPDTAPRASHPSYGMLTP